MSSRGAVTMLSYFCCICTTDDVKFHVDACPSNCALHAQGSAIVCQAWPVSRVLTTLHFVWVGVRKALGLKRIMSLGA